eukprot:CAMPEP_0184705014 /NCGR_PEP_ID=MMETSP0313-20130426/33009_1 /TAXON_ID=2792 /ORGANISM="Porphyridium aerugineum, Strain SAG 1380-2" /LENGTH=37 /DNA_ID= /DNA_START= /DNA_END= /DNA_ORIENTATION=
MLAQRRALLELINQMKQDNNSVGIIGVELDLLQQRGD